MKNVFRYWKKGIAFEVIFLLVAFVMGLLGIGIKRSTNLLFSLGEGLILTLSVTIMIIGFVIVPIIRGFVVEWLNKNDNQLNKFINI